MLDEQPEAPDPEATDGAQENEPEEPTAIEDDDNETAATDDAPEGAADDATDSAEAEEEEEAPAEAEAEEEAPAEAEAEDEAPAEAEAEEEAPAEAEAPADSDIGLDTDGDDDEEETVKPETQEYIDQDETVLHTKEDDDSPVPTEFRTPPGVAPGLVPGGPEDRETPPRSTS